MFGDFQDPFSHNGFKTSDQNQIAGVHWHYFHLCKTLKVLHVPSPLLSLSSYGMRYQRTWDRSQRLLHSPGCCSGDAAWGSGWVGLSRLQGAAAQGQAVWEAPGQRNGPQGTVWLHCRAGTCLSLKYPHPLGEMKRQVGVAPSFPPLWVEVKHGAVLVWEECWRWIPLQVLCSSVIKKQAC